MELMLLAGTANEPLGAAIARHLGVTSAARSITRFPDGELRVEVQASVRGRDVYLVQPTSPPVETHLIELLLLADACRRAGAARLTAVVPYFGYARQDRRAGGREAVGARVVADTLQVAGIQRAVAVDLHTAALEGIVSVPLEHVSAVPALVEAIRPAVDRDAVIVAPDLGATRLAERYASALDLPVAIVHKTRVSSERVSVRRVTGDVQGRIPWIVDDMISTGGTIEAAAAAMLAAGARPPVNVVASHALLVGQAVERLQALRLGRFVTTDSMARSAAPPLPIEVVSLAPLLGEAITRLHTDRSLHDLLSPS